MIDARFASCLCLKSKKFQGALRVCRAGRNTRRPLPFGLAKLSSSSSKESDFSAAVGQNESGKGRIDISPPARGRCAAKRSLPPARLARSSGQEDAISRRGRSVRDILPKSGGQSSQVLALSSSSTVLRIPLSRKFSPLARASL